MLYKLFYKAQHHHHKPSVLLTNLSVSITNGVSLAARQTKLNLAPANLFG